MLFTNVIISFLNLNFPTPKVKAEILTTKLKLIKMILKIDNQILQAPFPALENLDMM